MTITSMTATFGGLENQTLALKPGLNVLELPNEGGKSTWCAFLRAMFYGLESRKGRENSERNRFTPWSGARMSGSMDLIWRGKAITLRRFPKGSSPFGGFQAVYTGTEEPVPGLTADNVGQTLLGFGREVFERTCFICQGGMAVGASAELEQRLAALASSGEEDVSYSKTEAALRSWRNSLQANRANGSIPQLEGQRGALSVQLQRITALETGLRDADAREASLAQRQEALKTALDDLSVRHEKQYRQAYAAAQKKLAEAAMDEREAFLLRRFSNFYFLPFLLAIVLAALGGVCFGCGLPLLGAAFPLLGLGIAGYALVRRRRAKRERQARIDAAQAELDALERWEPPKEESERLQAELDQVTQALLTLRTRRAQATGELRAVGEPDELRAQIEDISAQLAREREQYAALTAAMEALDAAEAQLQLRFSPAVSALSGEILAKLTGGRYDSLTFTRAFEALAGARGDMARSAVLLSQGTADQTYLALRLAICLLALPQSDPAPLVLDDALVTFDDQRLSLALDVLADMAQTRQLLLFTCHSREKAELAQGQLH